MPSLHVSPSRIRPGATHTVVFTGTGTAWLSSTPTFSVSGVAGISVGALTVTADALASAPVTYGTATGTATWTDSTTGATVKQIVGFVPKFIARSNRGG